MSLRILWTNLRQAQNSFPKNLSACFGAHRDNADCQSTGVAELLPELVGLVLWILSLILVPILVPIRRILLSNNAADAQGLINRQSLYWLIKSGGGKAFVHSEFSLSPKKQTRSQTSTRSHCGIL